MSHILVYRHQLSRCLRFDRAYVLVTSDRVTLTWRFLKSKSPISARPVRPGVVRRHVEKHHGLFPNPQCSQQQMHLFNFENVRYSLALCRNPNTRPLARTCDWIAVSELPPYCMIENAAHRVADFFLSCHLPEA